MPRDLPPHPVSVLVIDDLAPVRRSLRRLLKAHGFEVIDVASGTEALAVLERVRVDVVTCDLNMPEMNGVEVLQAIQAAHPAIPVLIVSGNESPAARADVLAAGAAGWLEKTRSSELPEVLRVLLRGAPQPKQ